MLRRESALLAAALCVAGGSSAAAQDGCIFGDQGNDVLRQVTMTGGEAIFYVTRPHLVCEGGIQIWADSAEAFTSTNLAHLIGSVRYEDPTRTLVADEARYFSQVGRLQAEGSLRVDDRDEGSTIENGALVYLRETSFRPEESMTVTMRTGEARPRATLSHRRDDEEPRTYVVVGDRIESRGESWVRATGSAELAFDSILAFADTLEYEEDVDRLDLRGDAFVDAPDYDLRGQRVELTTPAPGTREIRALRDAELTGDDFLLTSERIFLYAADDRMERLVALPAEADSTGRPVAVAGSFEVTADSLEILAPSERLERLFAAGRARSVSMDQDSLTVESLPEIARRDWLEGDTIIVTFAHDGDVPADELVADTPEVNAPAGMEAAADPEPVEGTREVRVDTIVAIVSARSLYRMPPSEPGMVPGVDPPAVHYVVGDRITIVMRDGEVDRMEVQGRTTGVHLEPLGRRGPGG